MAVSIRNRPSRSTRMRGRNDSGEENVPLDLSRDPIDNLREILQNVSKQQGVSNMRKLGHLNNFVKLLYKVGHSETKLGFTYEEIIIWLALLNEAKEVRAAGLRALRHLIRDSSIFEKVLCLKVDYLIARSVDIQQCNEVERTQALRLVRKMITVNAQLFPSSITNSLIAVGNDGLHERDRMVRACVAIICELSLKNPLVVAQRGGLSTILKSVIDCQLSRINEALITTVLHLLNHPHTRQYLRSDVELEQILAPYTDFYYTHLPDTAEGHLKEDREARFLASKMSIVASFRSWSGIINLCKSGNSGIQSLIELLCIPNMDVRRALLEVIYDIFRLAVPIGTADFIEALISVDPSRFQDSWRLADGFVASEAKMILPHRTQSRPDLMDNYLALVLSAFIKSGLLEGLVEVITSSDDNISIQATILLGELLHMASTILPHSHSHHLHCLPNLMNMAASFDNAQDKRLRASAAVNYLKRFHEIKKRGPKPCSLYLDHILRTSEVSRCYRDQPSRSQRDIFIIKDTEDALMMNIKDSHILYHNDPLGWKWVIIGTILKWPNGNLHHNKDEQMHKFVQRLLYFYKPSSKMYASLELGHAKARQLTVVGCQFMEFLLDSDEEGQVYLEDFVRDTVQWLLSSAGLKPSRCLHSNGLLTTLSQHYFLFLGTLSAHPHGVQMMERCSVFQCLLNLCMMKNQDHLLKLTVSTLDYSRDGLARVILSKILTAATDNCRLYATKHLRVLLRVNVEFFSNWGIELLVTQLYDQNKTISMEALDILDEACEDKANLHTLIQMKPALTHLGDKGVLLLLRFLSIPKGFSYLNERGFISKQLNIWQKEYNLKYVDMIEEQLNEALTTYKKPVDGDNYVRRSNQRLQRPNVYLPVHLYGQLVHDKAGCHLLESHNVVSDLSYTIRSQTLDRWEGIKQLKAALWALGNIGSSNWGLNLLLEEGVIPDIVALAQDCEVLSIRGTCLYALGLLSKTRSGCEALWQQGWDTVRHNQRAPCPVAPDQEGEPVPVSCHLPSTAPSTLSFASEAQAHRSDFLHPIGVDAVDRERLGGCPSLHACPKLMKGHHSPLALLASSRLCHRLLHSLSLSARSQCCSGDLQASGGAAVLPSSYSFAAGDVFPARRSDRLAKSSSVGPESLWAGGGEESGRHSVNTDTTTSGVSSLSCSPSTDCVSLNTLVRAQHYSPSYPSLSKPSSAPLAPPGSAHTLPRRAPALRASRAGYATLKRLQKASLSHSETLASPAEHLLLTHAIAMTTGGLDSPLTTERFLKALSFSSLDREELNQTTPQRSPSLHSLVSTATCGFSEDYIGLALPINIDNMFQLKETTYFQKRTSPLSEDRTAKFFSGGFDCPSDSSRLSGLCCQLSITELMVASRAEAPPLLGSDDTGLQEHSDDNCLYCTGLALLGCSSHNSHSDLTEMPPFSEWCSTAQTHLELMVQTKLSGMSGCSDTISQGSEGSTRSTELVLGVKSMPEDAPTGRVLLRKEVLRLIINLSSSVGTKNHETSLLTIKEKFPYAFDDICLYSEVSYLLANCMFRLPSRRFIQELFQDVPFIPMYEEAESILSRPPRNAPTDRSL